MIGYNYEQAFYISIGSGSASTELPCKVTKNEQTSKEHLLGFTFLQGLNEWTAHMEHRQEG